MNSYYETHKRRYGHTLDIIKEYDLLKNGDSVLSLGPCGFFKDILFGEFKVSIEETECDLRYDIPLYKKYDLILCLEVIEHIKDKESNDINSLSTFTGSGIKSLIRESSRLINSNGAFLMSTPNIHCYKNIFNWINGDDLYTYALHPRELSEKYIISELKKYYKEIMSMYRLSWGCHGTPQHFIEIVEKFMIENNFSTDNRIEDNLFLISKEVVK